tara:strand:- start:998 stop:1135 length:138 start_codon:yes stop_codon:yes gene_type:complete
MGNTFLNTREDNDGSLKGKSSSEDDENQEKYFINMIKQSDYQKNI